MLRIQPSKPAQPPVVPPVIPPDATPPDPTSDPTAGAPQIPVEAKKSKKFSADLVDQDVARYMTPDMRCGSCEHFDGEKSCDIVSGDVEPDGVCMLFSAMVGDKKNDNPDAGTDGGGGSTDPASIAALTAALGGAANPPTA